MTTRSQSKNKEVTNLFDQAEDCRGSSLTDDEDSSPGHITIWPLPGLPELHKLQLKDPDISPILKWKEDKK